MTNTDHYNLVIAEGTDLVNPLTQIFPNFTTIDAQMWANKLAGIATATEVISGTVHALTRTFAGDVFRFTATGPFNAGDTFTVDGMAYGAEGVDGEVLGDEAYDTGSNVLCVLANGVLTVLTNKSAGVDLSQYMLASEYVGSGATKAVQTAVNATNASQATNATNLGGQSSAFYAAQANLAPLISGGVTAIQVVSALPSSPNASTLYLVLES